MRDLMQTLCIKMTLWGKIAAGAIRDEYLRNFEMSHLDVKNLNLCG